MVDATAQGLGLTPLSQALANALAKVAPTESSPTQATQQITGQKLEEQAQSEPIETDYSGLWWLLSIILIGVFYEYLTKPIKVTYNV